MMKNILKYGAILIVLLAIGGYFLFKNNNEAKPKGTPGADAMALTMEMERAINKAAWDTTAYVQWSFPRGHNYVWNKNENLVQVEWDVFQVLLNTKEITGRVYQSGIEVKNDKKDGLIQKAWSLFCNDSFWLAAPFKISDPGVETALVTLDDGREGLMASYKSGGVTPGDAYVWILDENKMPTSYKMWVDIIPLGGMEFTWDKWVTLYSGAKVATNHDGLFSIPITNLNAAKNLSEMGLAETLFDPIKSL